MISPLFVLLLLLVISVMSLTAYVLGARVLGDLKYDGPAERFGVCVSIGLGLFSLILFGLGMAAVLTRVTVLVGLLLIWIYTFPVWRQGVSAALSWLSSPMRRGGGGRVRLVLLVAAAAILTWPLLESALYPPSDWDDSSYHLPVARAYIEQGAITVLPDLRFPVFPQAIDLLFVPALMFAGELAPQWISLLAVALVALLIFAWGKRSGSYVAAILAAGIWLASPMVFRFGTTAYIDVGLTLFALLGAYGVFRWCESQDLRWLLISGFAVGIAAGSKYTGIYFGFAYLVWVSATAPAGGRLRSSIVFLVTAALIAAPWYLRNVVLVGDPLFPFLPEIFGYSFWSAADIEHQRNELSTHGMGRDWLAYFMVWWNIGWNQGKFFSESLSSLAFIVPIPLFIVLYRTHPTRLALAIIAFGYVTIWFTAAQILRYLLPILPLLTLLVADLVLRLLALLPERTKLWTRFAILGGLAIVVLSPYLDYAEERKQVRGPAPISRESREAYLTNRFPEYPALALLNRERGRDYTVYALRGEQLTFYAEGRLLGDVFGPFRASDAVSQFGDAGSLHHFLREMDVDYLLLSDRWQEIDLPRDSSSSGYFRLIYQQDRVRLYQLGAD